VPADYAHKPIVLYHASIERKEAAWTALEKRDHVLAIYLAGLSVECVLQAIALLDNPTHDARHDLPKWLARCRTSLQKTIMSREVRENWNLIVRLWRNDLRYLSSEGMLGYVRQFRDLVRGVRGGPDAIMNKVAFDFLNAVSRVHTLGVAKWATYTRK